MWRTPNRQAPEIEFDYQKLKIKIDTRGLAKLSGTLRFADLEKLPRVSHTYLLQCGAANPRGIVTWTGVKFADFADMLGLVPGAHYCRLVASDRHYVDEAIDHAQAPAGDARVDDERRNRFLRGTARRCGSSCRSATATGASKRSPRWCSRRRVCRCRRCRQPELDVQIWYADRVPILTLSGPLRRLRRAAVRRNDTGHRQRRAVLGARHGGRRLHVERRAPVARHAGEDAPIA